MLQNCFQCCDRRDLETFPKPGNEAGAAKAAFSTGHIYIYIYIYVYKSFIYPYIYYFLYIISLAPYFLILKLTLTTLREVLLTALL